MPIAAPVRKMNVDQLYTEIFANRQTLGEAAAGRVARWMSTLLAEQEQVTMVFAAAPSQHEFLATLRAIDGLAWDRVVALHMDEYIGLSNDHPQSFGNFLRHHLFDAVQPGMVHYLDGTADPERERLRYAKLLEQHPVDILCAGIGENGHLAFNDPPLARFDDPQAVRKVTLPESCRAQQVHDGCFEQLDDVPRSALTLTLPALMGAKRLSCVVPGPTKADAIAQTLEGPISESCPATILRQHAYAVLCIDSAAAAKLTATPDA